MAKALRKKLTSGDRQVIYKEVTVEVCDGKNAITVQRAKDLLGWEEEETEQKKFGSDYLLKDVNGMAVRCTNNPRNRRFNTQLARMWQSEILQGHWKLNGQTLIIGRTGTTISAQHRLAALVLAAQQWREDKDKWPAWRSEPTMPGIIVYGIEETDEVVNTIDTGKSRDFVDVLYRSEGFAKLPASTRSTYSKLTSNALRMIQHRTGASIDAFSPKLSNMDLTDYFSRHPRVFDCVKHVAEENGTAKRIKPFVATGVAAALCYLMATSSSDGDEYRKAVVGREDQLSFDRWDQACDFWVKLASGDKAFAPLREALASLSDSEGVVLAERLALIIKAWNCFAEGDPITADDLVLEYEADGDGVRRLTECPTVGGIDVGDPKMADEARIHATDPPPAVIEKRKQAVRLGRSVQDRLNRKGSKAGDDWADGDTAWVNAEDGEHYFGTISGEPWECDDGDLKCMVDAADGTWEVDVAQLCIDRPEVKPAKPQPKFPRTVPPQKTKRLEKAAGVVVGDNLWVTAEEPWEGRVVEVSGQAARLRVNQGHQGAGNVVVVPLAGLHKTQPGMKQ